MNPKVSIIITTRNRAQHLRETLASFRGLALPPDLAAELLVVDNASTDETAEVIKTTRLPQMPVRYLHEPKPGQSNARNSGMANTTGEVILFTDDDVRVPVDWVQGMAAPILIRKADAVAGGIKIAPHLERPWMTARHKSWLAATLRLDPLMPGRMIGANMAFSRSVLSRVPAFDEELGPGGIGFHDDGLFSAQLQEAGFVIFGNLDLVLEHYFEESRLKRSAWLSRAARGGRSDAYLDYHWYHKNVTFHAGKILTDMARLFRERWRSGFRNADEGCTEAEMVLLRRLAYLRYYWMNLKGQRNYNLHGLVKLNPELLT